MNDVHRCLAGCGKAITWRFAICADCERTYTSKPANWPEWLQWLWKDTLKERRRQKNQNRFEVDILAAAYTDAALEDVIQEY